jgi:ribonuclease HII
MIICGVEEAGRGPVIGPMVMAGCTFEKSQEDLVRQLGIKDSKLLTPQRREELYDTVIGLAKEHKIIILTAKQVDMALNDPELNLNWLEAITSAKIINSLKCDKAILDCPSNNLAAYTRYVSDLLEKDVELLAEHKADLNYPFVAAASILAKVTRDREIEKLKRQVGMDFGSGYPSDPRTKEFLLRYHDKHDIFRKSWASYKRIVDGKKQHKLDSF